MEFQPLQNFALDSPTISRCVCPASLTGISYLNLNLIDVSCGLCA